MVGKLFGPVMAVWFTVLALIGIPEIVRHPEVLRALSPSYGAEFFIQHGAVAFIALAGVVLAVTGAEALYADMGHFGRSPIRRAWFLLVFPALTINYLAQGALILRSPKAVENPFFLLVPGMGADTRRVPRDVRDRDRIAGGDLGRLQRHAAGGADRVPAPPRRSGTRRRSTSARSTRRRSTRCCSWRCW